jgi:signal transduction histidine kinase
MSKEEARLNILKKTLSIAEQTGHFVAEGIRVRKDGSHFWARSFITPIKGSDASVKFFVVITRNIMRERTLEQKREEYIGIASHELKNPITTLSLYAGLLERRLEVEGDKNNLSMLRDIQGQTARLIALVDDLLIVSKIEGNGTLELHQEIFDPNTFVKKLVRDFQKNTRTHDIILKGVVRHEVRADKNRIAQVMVNLLTNAVKYSPNANKAVVRIKQEKDKCVISIQDFGSGIARKDQKEIFTRFFRAADTEAGNIAGSGLGLYISREIIKTHHQKIWVKSTEGHGSTFSFTLSLSS